MTLTVRFLVSDCAGDLRVAMLHAERHTLPVRLGCVGCSFQLGGGRTTRGSILSGALGRR